MQKNELKRLRILYYIFFSLVVCSIAFVFLSIITLDSQQKNIAEQIKGKIIKGDNSYFMSSFLRSYRNPTEFDIPIYANHDSTLIIQGRVNTFDVLVQGQNLNIKKSKYLLLGFIFALVSIVSSILVLITLGLLLYSFWKSFKKGRIFSKKDIKYIRIIAILLIIVSIFSNFSTFFEHVEAARFLVGTEWATQVSIPIPFFEILFGIVILFISEFFTLGYRLQEDQELTI